MFGEFNKNTDLIIQNDDEILGIVNNGKYIGYDRGYNLSRNIFINSLLDNKEFNDFFYDHLESKLVKTTNNEIKIKSNGSEQNFTLSYVYHDNNIYIALIPGAKKAMITEIFNSNFINVKL
jgi:hypothetical protein